MIGVAESKKSSQASWTFNPFHYLNFCLFIANRQWRTVCRGRSPFFTWLRSRRAIRCSFGDQISSPDPTCRPFLRFLSCILKKTSTPMNSEKVFYISFSNFSFLSAQKSGKVLKSYFHVRCLSSKQLDCIVLKD